MISIKLNGKELNTVDEVVIKYDEIKIKRYKFSDGIERVDGVIEYPEEIVDCYKLSKKDNIILDMEIMRSKGMSREDERDLHSIVNKAIRQDLNYESVRAAIEDALASEIRKRNNI